jgi:hypothetical protein
MAASLRRTLLLHINSQLQHPVQPPGKFWQLLVPVAEVFYFLYIAINHFYGYSCR